MHSKLIEQEDYFVAKGGLALKVKLRLAEEKDSTAILGIVREKFPQSPINRSNLSESNRFFFVAEVRGNVVGFADLTLRESDGVVRGLCVEDDFNKLGIGTVLLNKAVEFAVKNGKKRIQLIVKADNESALSVYKKTGFMVKSHKTGETGTVYVMEKAVET